MPFIGKQSTSNSQITNYTTTVGSGGQTNFTVVIEGGDETHVYLNGVLLKETKDYTVSYTQVSLVSPAVENDIVEIKVFRSFALVDAVKASDGGTFSGDVTVPNLTLSSNVIKASDGGSTITLDTSDNVTLAGNLVIPDGGNIGSASDTDAIAISSGGNVTLSQTLDGGAIGSAVTMSANQACVKTAINASGSAPIYACRAFVQFDGDNSDNINSSGNVSSVDEGGNGLYTINFTTALASAGYSVVAMSDESSGVFLLTCLSRSSPLATGSVKVQCVNTYNSSFVDSNKTSVAGFL